MKFTRYMLLALVICGGLFTASLEAQTMRYEQVVFRIQKLRVFNDTIMVMRFQFQSADQSSSNLAIEGVGTLSMCGCYCDSIWDAWPSEVGNGIEGTATLGFASSSGGGPGGDILQAGRRRLQATLGIQQVEGGIIREEEFVVPATIQLR